jgi:mitochondrial fission protein ELM1
VVVCAVRYEPVSTGDSLLTGKLTGNFAISAVLDAISWPKAAVPQRLLAKFPKKINRENFENIRDRNPDIRVI